MKVSVYQKITNILSWTCLLSYLIVWSIFSFQLEDHFIAIIPIVALAISLPGFTLFFFFLNDRKLNKNYRWPWVRKIQGLFFIPFLVIYAMMTGGWYSWPVAKYMLVVIICIYVASLFLVKKVSIRYPIGIITAIVLLFGSIQLLRISVEHQLSGMRYAQLYKNQMSVINDIHLENHILSIHGSNNTTAAWEQVISRLDSAKHVIIQNAEQVSYSEAQPILDNIDLAKNLTEKDPSRKALLITGTFLDIKKGTYLNIQTLSSRLDSLLSKRLEQYPDEIKKDNLFKFSGQQNIAEITSRTIINKWDKLNFSKSAGSSLTRINNLQLTCLLELNQDLRVIANEQNKDLSTGRKKMIQTYFEAYNETNRELKETAIEQSQNYVVMYLGIAAIVMLFFYTPSFKTTKKWKYRIILFSIIIFFEFILLIIDLFAGLFSQNFIFILAINVLLALCLVTLDNYLRGNFFKWYVVRKPRTPSIKVAPTNT